MKMKSILSVFVVFAAAMNASAVTFEFIPRKSASRYDWATTDWKAGGSYVTSLPTKDDNAWITATLIRTSTDGMFINSGTDAEASKLYLANGNANSRPMKLTIDGGSLTTYGEAYIGQKSPGILTLQNGGTFEAKSVTYIGLNNSSTDSSQLHVFDAKLIIADAESSFTTVANVYMGHQMGGTSLLDNKGTVSITGTGKLQLGVWTNVVEHGDIVAVITNSGTLSVAGDALIGYRRNAVGRVENTGNLTMGAQCLIARDDYSEGYLRHSDGDLSVNAMYVGYRGKGYLELAGDTETVFSGGAFALARNDWNDALHSIGELVITNNASLSRGGKALTAAINSNAVARIALYDNAKLSDFSQLILGNSKADNSFEVYDNAVVSNVNLLVLNVGSAASGVTGTTTMKLSGNAKVCDIGNMYVGSNSYNHAELEIADNAWFGLCDDAWNGDKTNVIEIVDGKVVTNKVAGAVNNINVARDSYRSGDATIRMRGGTIGLGIRGGLVLGRPVDNNNLGCTSRVVGYGCITNQGNSAKTFWSRLDLYGGAVTADGEGVERDLDFSTFARLGGSVGDGRNNLNNSGTNGWYAVNKGRLIYPNRDTDKDVRFVGDYARLGNNVYPKLVNSMRILLKDSNGTEITGSARKFAVELYAPDRTDIPAGLVADDAKNRRLGIWRGNCTRSFATADTLIRYDQWRLDELRNAQGNTSRNFEIGLYQYDGTKWKKLASYPATEAAANNYRIGGVLAKTSVASANLGWFAVVATEVKGCIIYIR